MGTDVVHANDPTMCANGKDASTTKRTPGARRRRAAVLAAAAVLTLAVGMALALLGATRSSSFRQAALTRLSRALESRTGLRLEARDWQLEISRRQLSFEEPSLSTSTGEPIVSLRRLQARPRWRALLGGRLELDSLILEDLDLELAQARRSLPRQGGGGSETPLSIAHFEISGGSVRMPRPADARFDGWVDDARLTDVDVSGSLERGVLTAEVRQAELVLVGERRGPPLALDVRGTLVGPLASGLSVEELVISGPGVDLRANGKLSGADAGGELDYLLELDIAGFAPALEASGRLQASGALGLGDPLRLYMAIDARQVPAALLEPWLGRAALARSEVEGSTLDLVADVAVDAEASEPLSVRAEGRWVGPRRVLLEGSVTAHGAALDDQNRFDPGQLVARARIVGDELPAEIFQNWLDERRWKLLGAGGTTLDVALELAIHEPSGRGAELSASAFWRREGQQRARVELELEDEQWLFGDQLDTERWHGTLSFETADLGAAPFLSLAGPIGERLMVDNSVARASGRFDLQPGGRAPLSGTARLTWSAPGATIVDLVATGQQAPRAGASLDIEASVLPNSPSPGSFAGVLDVPRRSRPEQARWRTGLLSIDVQQLDGAVSHLGSLWPRLITPQLRDRTEALRGALAATGEVTGDVLDPTLVAGVHWQSSEHQGRSSLHLGIAGQARSGGWSLEAETTGFELRQVTEAWNGTLAGRASLDLTGDEPRYRAEVESSGFERVVVAEAEPGATDEPTSIESVALSISGIGNALELQELAATWGGIRARAKGRSTLGPGMLEGKRTLPLETVLELELDDSSGAIERVELTASLDRGQIQIATSQLRSRSMGEGYFELDTTLASLRSVPWIASRLNTWSGAFGEPGSILVAFDLPEADSAMLGAGTSRVERLSVSARGLRGELELEPNDWGASRGKVSIGSLVADRDEHRLTSQRPVELRLDGGAVELPGTELLFDGEPIEINGRVELDRSWRRPRALSELVEQLSLHGRGRIEASAFNRFLGGGAATGTLDVTARVEGPLDRVQGHVQARSIDAEIVYISPFETRFENLDLTVRFEPGKVVLERATGALNQGRFELAGTIWDGHATDLNIALDSVRYRLSYGLSALADARVRLQLPAEGQRKLTGSMLLRRGLVREDIDLEREIRGVLFGFADLTGTEERFSESLDLELELRTLNGVRVNNNVASLTAFWTPLTVRGTLAEPSIRGAIEVDPGGLLFAYGQVVRLDRASLLFSGRPREAPRIEAVTTNSIEDPTLRRHSRQDPFADEQEEPATSSSTTGQAVAGGVAQYYGGRVAAALGESLGGTRLEIEPLLFFEESDPDARLTISRDLSSTVAVGVSLNLRSAQRRTYLLDLHHFSFAPRVGAQLFSNERGNEGATVRHEIELGGSESRPGPLIEEVVLPSVPEISPSALRASLDLRKGMRLPDGGVFDLEVQVADYLRSHGYPEARASAHLQPGKRRGAETQVRVVLESEVGAHVAVEFHGDRPRPRERTRIASLYRDGYYQELSVQRMREASERALRAQGFLEPEISIDVSTLGDDDQKLVVVRASGGERLRLGPPRFTGIDDQDREFLAARFSGAVARMELAAAADSADRRLLRLLRSLGHAQARIMGRGVSRNGRVLTVDIEPGPRQSIGSVSLAGVSEEETKRLLALSGLQTGASLRRHRLSEAALAIEDDLQRRGHIDASVRVIAPFDAADRLAIPVTLEIDSGPRYTFDQVELEGLRATRSRWARGLADLEPGQILDPRRIAEARRRFLETGIYDLVSAEIVRTPEGRANVVFGLEERPRMMLSYGLRWENARGLGAVADMRDRNLLGRGMTLGLRLHEASDERSARLYGALPRPFGTSLTLESFAEIGEEHRAGLTTDRTELSLQASLPLGATASLRGYGRYREERQTEALSQAPSRSITSPILGLQYVHDGRREGLWGPRGLFGTVDLSGASTRLGGDSGYLRLFGQLTTVDRLARIAGRDLVWAQSYRLGVATTGGQTVPQDVRFLAGGEYSVRGYPFESLGPHEAVGDQLRAVGGDSLLVLNQELRLGLSRTFQAILFFDAGNVWQEGDFGDDLFTALGLGLRARTPIGLLRLDAAIPFEARPNDPDLKVYFGLSQVF